jgi:hypothetical protein
MIILRQKEYTSLPRKIGAKLKRTRVDFANLVGKGLQKNSENRDSYTTELLSSSGNKTGDKKLLTKLIGKAKNDYDARVLTAEPYFHTGNITSETLKKHIGSDDLRKVSPKLANAVGKNKNIIFLSKLDGYDPVHLAHEIGHLQNNKRNRGFNRRYHKMQDSVGNSKLELSVQTAKYIPVLEKSGNRRYIDSNNIDTGIGIKEYFKRALEGRDLVKEEKKASKNGIKILKQSGADKSTLSAAKESMKKALNTYKTSAKIYRRSPLQNLLLPDSRRRK